MEKYKKREFLFVNDLTAKYPDKVKDMGKMRDDWYKQCTGNPYNPKWNKK